MYSEIGGTTVYCDFETAGGPWTIAVLPISPGAESVASASNYRDFCEAHGLPLAGRGVGTPNAWLAQKAMLWDTHHDLMSRGWGVAQAQGLELKINNI